MAEEIEYDFDVGEVINYLNSFASFKIIMATNRKLYLIGRKDKAFIHNPDLSGEFQALIDIGFHFSPNFDLIDKSNFDYAMHRGKDIWISDEQLAELRKNGIGPFTSERSIFRYADYDEKLIYEPVHKKVDDDYSREHLADLKKFVTKYTPLKWELDEAGIREPGKTIYKK